MVLLGAHLLPKDNSLASHRIVAVVLQVQKAFLELKIAQERLRSVAGMGTILQKEPLRSQVYMGIGKRGPRKGTIGQEKNSLQPLPESLSVRGFCPHLRHDGKIA